jgi:hypothetical protein
LFFPCNFARSIWSVIQAASGLYPPTSIANVFGNWVHGIDSKYIILLRVGAMALIWSLGYVEMTKSLIINYLLSCRLSTDIRALSYYGHNYTDRGTTTSFRRCAHAWRIRRGTFSRIMDGSIICALALHQLRCFTISHSDM